MKIYIDESGWFNKHMDCDTKDKAWCVVGAITIPHSKEKVAYRALLDLKKNLGLNPQDEIKRNRPEPGSPLFISFANKLREAGCSVHAITANRFLLNDEESEKHKIKQILAREEYINLRREEFSDNDIMLMKHDLEVIKELIYKSSIQEYNQIVLQSALVAFMLDKTMAYYGAANPRELSRFSWIIDRKNINQGVFEELYMKLMPPFVEVDFIRSPRGIPFTHGNYEYFFKNFSPLTSSLLMDNKEINKRKKIYGMDYSKLSRSMLSFDFKKLLTSDIKFSDSNKSPGLQIADLVVSGLNRFLKGNVDSAVKASEILGSLVLNSPRLDFPSVPHLKFYDTVDNNSKINHKNLELLNKNSRKLYSDPFRRGFTKNLDVFLQEQSQPNVTE